MPDHPTQEQVDSLARTATFRMRQEVKQFLASSCFHTIDKTSDCRLCVQIGGGNVSDKRVFDRSELSDETTDAPEKGGNFMASGKPVLESVKSVRKGSAASAVPITRRLLLAFLCAPNFGF